MKSSTSWFCTSRKYSAMVSADSATRRRVPGGSSIWPKTSAVSLMTPASAISTMRSLPSRVRSPTPANTEVPPKLRATRVIISWMSTVLPTPAPPNRPILPPLTYGVEQVDDLDAGLQHLGLAARARSNGRRPCGGSPHRSSNLEPSPGSSRHSPSALNTWPLTPSPTGTEIGRPVSVHLGAADQTVGGLHRDGRAPGCRPGAGRPPGSASWRRSPSVDVDVQRVEELRHRVARELDVDDRADDPDDAAGGRSWSRYRQWQSSLFTSLRVASALAPPTISLISWVIWA